MLHLFVLLFITQNTIHQRIIRCVIENCALAIAMGLQNANESEFHGFGNLVTGLWRVIEIFLKEFIRTHAQGRHFNICLGGFPWEFLFVAFFQ